jgi:type VI protein secretion system component VasF
MIEASVFAEIVRAQEDTGKIISAALGRAGKATDLEALRGRLRRRLEELEAALSKTLSPLEVVELLTPIAFFMDERVGTELSRRGEEVAAWPLLQRDLLEHDDDDGGDQFYDNASRLLGEKPPRELFVATYLHCLQAGFMGRYFDDPAGIQRFKEDLGACLKPPELPPAAPAKPPPPAPRPRSFYVLVAAGVALGAHLLLGLLSLFWPS